MVALTEVFKRVYGILHDRAPLLDATRFSLFELSIAPRSLGPPMPPSLTLPDTVMVGGGAIGNGIAPAHVAIRPQPSPILIRSNAPGYHTAPTPIPGVACHRPDLSTHSASTLQCRASKAARCGPATKNTLVSASAIAPVSATTVTPASARGE